MKKHWVLALAALGCLAPISANGQTQPETTAIYERSVAPSQAAATGQPTMRAIVETKTTPDRPYSAESVTETVQALADGNRISHQSVTRVYRDGAGRTRRETLDPASGEVRSIVISDPVGHVSFTLDPKSKTAYKSGGNMISAARGASGVYTLTTQGEPPPAAASGGGGGGRGVATVSGSAVGGGGRGGTMTRTTMEPNPNVKNEEVGPQNIEGVVASGTRTTTIIPAGKIGNAQEIKVVSERWFSDELQVLVMTRHSDPRSGETTYRLRNILRAEPDPALFTVPADYTFRERR